MREHASKSCAKRMPPYSRLFRYGEGMMPTVIYLGIPDAFKIIKKKLLAGYVGLSCVPCDEDYRYFRWDFLTGKDIILICGDYLSPLYIKGFIRELVIAGAGCVVSISCSGRIAYIYGLGEQ